MSEQIYEIQIALKRIKPKIWRRILIPSDLLLPDFHKVIQSTMGWTNSHLHQFKKGNKFYKERIPVDDFWDEITDVDYANVRISDVLSQEKEKITYVYDFGDRWEHDIILEKILPADKHMKYPSCLTGKRTCPPEDCGGTWGYEEMLEILKQPDHEEYESYLEWLGEEFDPEFFDMKRVNALLKTENFGVFEI